VRDAAQASHNVRGYVVCYEGSLEDITERKRAEEALRESEHKLKEAQALGRIGNWEFDADYGTIEWSDETYELYERDPALGPPTPEEEAAYYAPEQAATLREYARRAIETGEQFEYDLQAKLPSGRTAFFSASMRPIRDESGRVVKLFGTVQDITRRKRAEEALRETNETLEAILESAPVPILTLDLEGRVSLIWNPAAEQVLGWRKQEVLGKPYPAIPPGKEEEFARNLALAISGEGIKGAEAERRRRDGTPIDYSIYTAPLHDSEGCVMGIVAILLDITERNQVEEERERLLAQIREQAQRVQQIIDTVPEGVLLLDADLRVILANPVAEGDLAVLAGAKVGDTLTHLGDRSLSELLACPPRGFWHEVAAESLASRYFEIIAKSVEADSAAGGWVLVIRDVTQEREVEQQVHQQERLAAVGQLAGGIAHDFNNLLTTIILYAHMPLGKHDLPPDVTRSLETILEQTNQAARLVSQILDFSRRSPIKTQLLGLGSLVEDMAEMLQRTLPENIHLDVEVGTEKHVVDADPSRIRQVVMNLALNTRDAMPEGGELRVALSRVEIEPDADPPVLGMPAGEWVCLTVSDTGMGMSEEVQSHLFEPFFTTKGPGKGTGLGLAQVHGIVTQHKGHIGVETEPGKGTTFSIYLPARPGEVEEAAEEIAASPQGKGEAILLVEDNANLREASQRILESLGYRVLVAADGQEALVVHRSAGDVDLVITDLVMPEMGGRELVQELRKTRPDLKALAITGYVMREDLHELREEGFLDVVHKPFDADALARVVRRALDVD
jgi:two-component system cell cycle sensor histidine kinase/response regulator CckA